MRFFQAYADGRRSTTHRISGIFGATANARKSWYKDESAFTSNIFGTCSLRIKHTRFQRRNEKPTPKRIPNRGGCARRGPISRRGRNWPKILLNFRKRN